MCYTTDIYFKILVNHYSEDQLRSVHKNLKLVQRVNVRYFPHSKKYKKLHCAFNMIKNLYNNGII